MRTGHSISPAGAKRKPVWADIAGRFSGDRDCLAAFLALETAEILGGVKPSSLINLANRRQQCGRNFYALWKKHGAGLIMESCLEVLELVDRGDSMLLLLYRHDMLERLLAVRGAATMLRKAGYRNTTDTDSALNELRQRMADGEFPHEIGIFLGYPLKDVAGFLGWARLPVSGNGPWRMYGDPCESRRLAESFRHCRCRIASCLADRGTAYELLGAGVGTDGKTGVEAFFRTHH